MKRTATLQVKMVASTDVSELQRLTGVKLKGKENWGVWKYSTEIALEHRGHDGIVFGKIKKPSEYKADGKNKKDGDVYLKEPSDYKRI